MAAQELVSKSRYIRVQNWTDTTLGMSIPREFADNLGIKKHDTLRVTQENDTLIVRRVVE